jgi:hypothetical protein
MTAPLPLGVTFFHRRLPEASYPNEVAKYTNQKRFLLYITFVYLCIISNFGGPKNEIVQRIKETRQRYDILKITSLPTVGNRPSIRWPFAVAQQIHRRNLGIAHQKHHRKSNPHAIGS